MTATDYQAFTKTTAIYPQDQALPYLALGLASEAGEVAGKVKKLIRDDRGVLNAVNKDGILREVGGTLWYASELCNKLGVTLEEVFELNRTELLSRQSRGTLGGSGDNR